MWHHDLMWRYENEICDETGIFSDFIGIWFCGWGAECDGAQTQEAETSDHSGGTEETAKGSIKEIDLQAYYFNETCIIKK